jgi:Protein of unknown function (DUF3455)
MRKLFDATVVSLFVIGASAASLPQSARADDIQVEAGNVPFLVGHGKGTQNYVCVPSGSGFAWTLFTPQATLFDDHDKQLITHFFSPNPHEDGKIRVTWEDSRDTSTVWGAVIGHKTVSTDAIDWLLIQVEKIGAQNGPTGGDTLTPTSFIQRVNTTGGLAPPTGCDSLANVGSKAFRPYTADYVFYVDENAQN